MRHSRGIKNPVVKYIPYSEYDIHKKIYSNFIKKENLPFEPILYKKKSLFEPISKKILVTNFKFILGLFIKMAV